MTDEEGLPADEARGQIDLLMEEYRALRNDIGSRVTAQTTLLGFTAAGLAVFVGTRDAPGWVYGIVVGTVLTVLTVVFLINLRWIRAAGNHVARIESRVNALARIAYGLMADEILLSWQTSVNRPRSSQRRIRREF